MGCCLVQGVGHHPPWLLFGETVMLVLWLVTGTGGYALSRSRNWGRMLLVALLPLVASIACGYLVMCLWIGGELAFRTFCLGVLPFAIVTWAVCYRRLGL